MDVKVTIDKHNQFNRVRFERGIPAVTDFTHESNGNRLNVSLKGAKKSDYDNAIGTDRELEVRSKLILAVVEAMEYVQWLKGGK